MGRHTLPAESLPLPAAALNKPMAFQAAWLQVHLLAAALLNFAAPLKQLTVLKGCLAAGAPARRKSASAVCSWDSALPAWLAAAALLAMSDSTRKRVGGLALSWYCTMNCAGILARASSPRICIEC